MTEMLCSTIVPTIGRATLQRTVNSVLSQGLGELTHEVIVVNDSGEPLEKAEFLEHPQVRVVTINRCGEGTACNVGAALARGTYLNFIHDDDYLLPGALQALISVADDAGYSWIFGAYDVVTDEGNELYTVDAQLPSNPFGILLTGECVHIGASLLRREAFFGVGGFDPLLRALLDRDLQVRMAMTGQFAAADRVVACIRVSQGKASAYRNADIVAASRRIREKALNAAGATERAIDSIGSDPFVRGRVSRSYVLSGGVNLLCGRFWTMASRLLAGLRVASYFIIFPSYWRGALYRMRFDAARKRIDSDEA